MAKFCEKCGAPLKEGAKFCTSCGAKIEQHGQPMAEQEPIQTQPVQQPTQTSRVMSTTPTYPQPKKSKAPLLIGLIIAVVVVIVIAALLMQPGGIMAGGDESKFIGTWEAEVGYDPYVYTYTWVFNSDKTLEWGMDMGGLGSSTAKIGTWKIESGKLAITVDLVGHDLDTGSYDYSFSNSYNILSLEQNNVPYMTLIKQ